MLITAKQRAALKALQQRQQRARYGDLPPKRMRALQVLERRYHGERERRRREQDYEPLSCDFGVDRFVITVSEPISQDAWNALRKIPGYGAAKEYRLYEQPYGRAVRIRGTASIKEFIIQYERKAGWFARYRITLIAVDGTGLRYDDLRLILGLLPAYTIVLLELAFDFPIDAIIDGVYVRRHALFGRSQPRNVANYPLWDCWGTRKSSKFVRIYVKVEIDKFRIELELHARFLRHHKIHDVFDFHRLAEIIPQHILFAKLDWDKLATTISASGRTAKKVARVSAHVDELADNLWETLRYLRRRVGMKNVRRLLIPLEINTVIRGAVQQWAAQWPSVPARLQRTETGRKD